MNSKNTSKVTFNNFDKLNLKIFAENLFQIMEKGADSSIGDMGEKGSYTLSLNAEFGNGKTTFLKMFEHFVNTEKSNFDVVFINAWESDFYSEPVIAILSEFVNWIERKPEEQTQENNLAKEQNGNLAEQKNKQTNKSTKGEISKSARAETTHKKTHQTKNQNPVVSSATNQIKQVIGILANQVIQIETGFNIKEFIACFSAENNTTVQNNTQNESKYLSLGENVFEEFNQRKEAIQKIKKIISEHLSSSSSQGLLYESESVKEGNKKLLIIVDELDRTRPDYAVHFLEDMKHFFDIKNVVFLVAVNRQQMEATVKCLYGQDLDFHGYYRKFFKQEMNLPDPYKEAQRLVDDLLQKTKVKYQNRSIRRDNTYLSCRMFGLTLRDVEQFVRIFEITLGDEQKMAKWAYQDAYSFFICLYMKEKKIFQQILAGQFTAEHFIRFVDKKGFKYKDDNDLSFFFGTIAYSFISNSDPKSIYDKIEEHFPVMKGRRDYRVEYFDARYGQPAIKICENINQCKSVFNS